MNNLTGLFLVGFLLGFISCDLVPELVPGSDVGCPSDFASSCDLQCPNGNYILDSNGCPTCSCAVACPEIKCRANCGDGGYVLDENGCQTCKCIGKVECSRVMCRMFCQHGFKKDDNGCPYCACNPSPPSCPILNCDSTCPTGYRKDYGGCETCDCIDEPRVDDKCVPVTCDSNCKYGYQRDENGCQTCVCNQCPVGQCKMLCMYGFKKNEEGCDICECDWTPVAGKIQCDERIGCPETRICNLNLRLCETVNPDRINWFLYDFQAKNELFRDDKFVQTFKNGLINNIAAKYDLSPSQIVVSDVQGNGLTSFQIMPYFADDLDAFDQKMDQIDIDLNSHEFRKLLPAVASTVEPPSRLTINKWCQKIRTFVRSKFMLVTMVVIISIIALIIGMGLINMRHRYSKISIRSDSKTPIADASYHLGDDDADHFHTVSAADGTKYVVVSTDDTPSSNDKRVLV